MKDGTRTKRLKLSREYTLPDRERLELLHTVPALGPKILFFSGGSALKDLSVKLISYTYNSIHLITPFDSGGSSAILRQAFHMPAIGDIRNRLMALADQSIRGNPEIYRLFAHRLPLDAKREELARELTAMAAGRHPLVSAISSPMRKIISHHLKLFCELMPSDFTLAGASIGNLILTAGYLENRRHLDPVIYIYSKLAEVRGIVRPVVSSDSQLAVELENGQEIVGQHLITGKTGSLLSSRIKKLYLKPSQPDAVNPTKKTILRNKTRKLISSASLICYPMGSFYTSLLATLLPSGVGSAIAGSKSPKIYIPNTGIDPESCDLSLSEQVETLLDYLKREDSSILDHEVLDFILLDRQNGSYRGELDSAALKKRGIQILDCELIKPASAPLLDAQLLANILLSLG
ncbi:MAG: GAK system CofD-like protein [Deltaproteobacteria bacterium]|nr:GAK system CofD-like protein [Deltaproteobacteria bacterium]